MRGRRVWQRCLFGLKQERRQWSVKTLAARRDGVERTVLEDGVRVLVSRPFMTAGDSRAEPHSNMQFLTAAASPQLSQMSQTMIGLCLRKKVLTVVNNCNPYSYLDGNFQSFVLRHFQCILFLCCLRTLKPDQTKVKLKSDKRCRLDKEQAHSPTHTRGIRKGKWTALILHFSGTIM